MLLGHGLPSMYEVLTPATTHVRTTTRLSMLLLFYSCTSLCQFT